MRRALLAMLTLVVAAAVPSTAFGLGSATETTTAEMVSMDSGLDGETVIFSGEVVSEDLAGGDGHVWLNVLSEGVAVGVWMPRELAGEVNTFGKWSTDGDTVEVVGVLHEACDQHGGDLDVHAEELTLLEPGTPREHPVSLWKIGGGIAALIAAAVLVSQRARANDPLRGGWKKPEA